MKSSLGPGLFWGINVYDSSRISRLLKLEAHSVVNKVLAVNMWHEVVVVKISGIFCLVVCLVLPSSVLPLDRFSWTIRQGGETVSKS